MTLLQSSKALSLQSMAITTLRPKQQLASKGSSSGMLTGTETDDT